MSDGSPGDGWWQASDGRWYPPRDGDAPPGPGWWRASDGRWYPPRRDGKPPAPGWWLASNGRWYPPEKAPGRADPKAAPATEPAPPTAAPADAPAASAAASAPPAAAPAAPTSAASRPAGDQEPPTPDPAPPAPATAATTDAPAASTTATAAPPADAATTPGTTDDGKPRVVKKVAVKKVVKKVAAKKAAPPAKVGASAAPSAKAKATKPPASKAPTKKAATKAAAPHVVRRQDLDDEPGGSGGRPSSPEDQIAARNRTSAQDARFLAAARAKAAQKAVLNLQAMIDDEVAAAPPTKVEPAKAPSPPAPAAKAEAAPAPTPPAPKADRPPTTSKVAAHKAKARADKEAGATLDRAPSSTSGGETPLMEVKPSPMAADLDRIGERLVIFDDRVELHDRSGRVRSSIAGEQIADVVVSKRFTGSVVTVEAGDGTSLQAKGLRPDQAEEIRELIMRRTRRKGPAPTRDARPDGPEPQPAAAEPARPAAEGGAQGAAAADLLGMLDALHAAGILTEAELAEKRALVARLRRAERLAPTAT